MNTSIVAAVVYFFVSTVLTWWFIKVSPLYISLEQMILSCSIAGAKWTIQIVAALALLHGEKKWGFIKNIGFTCLVGSVILIPYCLSEDKGAPLFVGSLLVSVITMIVFYFLNVKKSVVSLKWWFGWLFCLAIAITLQLTVVFDVL